MSDRIEAKLDALDARLQTIVAYIQNGVKDNKTAIKDHIDKQDNEVQNLHTRINKTREQFESHSKEVLAALEIIREHKIAVNDLHQVILDSDYTKCLQADGCHMSDFGQEVLAQAVANAVGKLL